MVRISVLNDALRSLSNAEKRGHRQCLVRPSSKVVIKFLALMAKKGEWVCLRLVGGGGGGKRRREGARRESASARALAIGRRRPSGGRGVLACPSRPSTRPRHAHASARLCLRKPRCGSRERHALCVAAGRPMKQKTTLTSSRSPPPGYINEFEYVDDHRAGKIVVELNGR